MRVTTIVEIKAPKDYQKKKLEAIHHLVRSLESGGVIKGNITLADGVKIKWKPYKTETQKPAETDMQ